MSILGWAIWHYYIYSSPSRSFRAIDHNQCIPEKVVQWPCGSTHGQFDLVEVTSLLLHQAAVSTTSSLGGETLIQEIFKIKGELHVPSLAHQQILIMG
ncbi:hypothetical protein CEXT_642011 [Caerostris extrusa]|uniref:Uncharacterized protein n=1 Tax=Caerostris extrusa TaxID=172846 RepID=A0AAV4Q821_CAEEX|nr:hypothetical protein CEXT_642011 [Caerostris extrusa]